MNFEALFRDSISRHYISKKSKEENGKNFSLNCVAEDASHNVQTIGGSNGIMKYERFLISKYIVGKTHPMYIVGKYIVGKRHSILKYIVHDRPAQTTVEIAAGPKFPSKYLAKTIFRNQI